MYRSNIGSWLMDEGKQCTLIGQASALSGSGVHQVTNVFHLRSGLGCKFTVVQKKHIEISIGQVFLIYKI